MSATNRGSKRKESDFYATPLDCIQNFLNNYDKEITGDVLEPSAGNGNISKILKQNYNNINLTSLELREEEKHNLNDISDEVIIGDFLQLDIDKKYDFISLLSIEF